MVVGDDLIFAPTMSRSRLRVIIEACPTQLTLILHIEWHKVVLQCWWGALKSLR